MKVQPASVSVEAAWVTALLGEDGPLRARLFHGGVALLLMSASVGALALLGVLAGRPQLPLLVWAGLTWTGMTAFWLLMRSGQSRRLSDPSMTGAQLGFAITAAAVAYALLGPLRAAVLPPLMVLLLLGIPGLVPRHVRWLSAYAVVVFGAVMLWMSLQQAPTFPPWVELTHFSLLALSAPAFPLLAARLHRIRQRARAQRAELAQALARLREHSTRDELTGLINRRHMEALMEQEHQRCIRSGQSFCLAVLDVDHFKPVNEAHGYAVGDAVLRAVAQEAQAQVRLSDTLCRWGSDDFVLMMSDARAPLARSGLERMQQRVRALRILHGPHALAVSTSAGLAEHRPGETVGQTLARAEQALREAKAAGAATLLVAP